MIDGFYHTPRIFDGTPGYEVVQLCGGRVRVKQWLPKCPAVVGILTRRHSTEVTAGRFDEITDGDAKAKTSNFLEKSHRNRL